jgi:hypothetical protein
LAVVRRAVAGLSFRVQLALIGVGATFFTLVAQVCGWLAPLERGAYDVRARVCQVRAPATTRLAHVHIDDQSLDAVGKWPWPRRHLGDAIDVLMEAGARLVAVDLLFAEESGGPTTAPAAATAGSSEDDDALAWAIGRAGGRVILPVTLGWKGAEPGAAERALRRTLTTRPMLGSTEVQREFAGSPEVGRVIRERFSVVRQQVLSELIAPALVLDDQGQQKGQWRPYGTYKECTEIP